MTLATILVAYFLSASCPSAATAPDASGFAAQDQNSSTPSQSQAPPSQTASPEPASTAPAEKPPSSSAPAKPSAKTQGHRKKTSTPDCSISPATGSAGSHPTTDPADSTSAALKPCPPPKVIIKNGGSEEPIVELKGNASQQQASQQRFTTEQLMAATEENLKKIAGRQLKPSEQETVSQIKQFMDQSKSAVAAGDLSRGHNLANKARLLSDELVKP